MKEGEDENDAPSTSCDNEINGEASLRSHNVSEYSYYSEDIEKSNDIPIHVNVVSRMESSIDTNYEDYLEKFDANQYVLQMEPNEEEDTARTELEENSNNSTCLKQQKSSDSQMLYTENDVNDIVSDDEQNLTHTPEAEFWHGYGSNIYFQPMTCKTLPHIHVKSKNGNPRTRRRLKSNHKKVKRHLSPVCFRFDTPGAKDALENIGTLRIADNKANGKWSLKEYSSRKADESRVGNFVMSEELKAKLCKGFVCRTDKSSFSAKGFSNRDIDAHVKATVNPTRLGNRDKFHGKKIDRTSKSLGDLGRMSRSLGSQDFLSIFPRMTQARTSIEKFPRKKTISGKSLFLTSSSQSINKINLFPFNRPLDCKESEKVQSLGRLPHPSPVTDEEKNVNDPEEKVVTDHLQEMKVRRKRESKNIKSISKEEHYAYERLFTYYNEKVRNAAKAGSLKNTLMTRSLLSPRRQSGESLTINQSLENVLNHAADRKLGNDKKLGTDGKHGPEHVAIHVTGTELNLSGKNSLPYDSEKNEKTSPLGDLSCSDTHNGVLFAPVNEQTGSGYSQNNCLSTDDITEEFASSIDLNNHGIKSVHFRGEERRIWLNDMEPAESFITAAVRPVDRYEIPRTKNCRLPILGQKIRTNTS